MVKLSSQKSDPVFRRWAVPLFVYGTWAAMLTAALAFVATYGSNVPSWDGWDMVPTMTGIQPVTLDWLWSQHNEHRIPVPRLVMLALYRVFGCDFRVGMYFNVLSTAALALGMILVARRLRGSLNYTDAFFSLLLLNYGQGVNFIWGWQVEFYLSTVLAGVALLLIAQAGPRPTVREALMMAVLLALLTGSGAHGVALVPALAGWLILAGISRWRAGDSRDQWDGLVILGLAFFALLLVVLYLVGFERVPHHPFTSGPMVALATGVKFLALSFGPLIKDLWPFSGMAVLGLLLSCGVVLLVKARVEPGERHRALGLFCFLGAMGSLALAIGLGRNEFEPRYITLSVPVMCCAYYVYQLYGSPRVSLAARAILFAVPCAALWPNIQYGIAYATDLRSRLGAFEADMEAGVPSHLLIHRYGPYLHIHQEILVDYMPLLRRAGVGSFIYLKDDPAFRKIPVPLHPKSLSQVEWEEGAARLTGRSPSLVFPLPEERYVCGIRLRYTHTNEVGILPLVSFYWRSHAQEGFTSDRYLKHSPTGDRLTWERGTWLRRSDPETTLIVWVCTKVSEIRIDPDLRPGLFKISELALLVPANE